ncbi:unnamed protein product [Alternaria alternata]
MANLPRPFLIELDGQFVANPRMSGEMDEYTKIPASIGDRANAAIFELRDGYLRRLGGPEPLHFGRFFVEPPLYGPLPLYWIANRNQVRPSQYIGDEDSPQTFEMAGFHIGLEPGRDDSVHAKPPGMPPGKYYDAW